MRIAVLFAASVLLAGCLEGCSATRQSQPGKLTPISPSRPSTSHSSATTSSATATPAPGPGASLDDALAWVQGAGSRLQERARAARYALLADCAIAIRAQAIVTAHHADDQAETILFRLTRGSGVAGLSGMAQAAPCGPVTLLRPLLETSKSDLEAICHEAGHPYVIDPSNQDDKFARARLRRLAPALAAQGLDRVALTRLGRRARQATEALDFYARAARETARIDAEADRARYDASVLARLPTEILLRLLSMEIARLAPGAQLRLERLERLGVSLVAALAGSRTWRTTLAGVLIDIRKDELILRRAPPRRRQETADGPGGM